MDGLQIEDAARAQQNTAMHQHLHQKLGRPTDLGQKTPLRGGLGLMVNESKTPGAKSLQGLASTRKTALTSVKKAIPFDDEYEVFQDEPEEEMQEEMVMAEPLREVQAQKPECSSPIEPANRCQDSYDSLQADIVDDMLNWHDSVELVDEQPINDSDGPDIAEQEALASLGVEDWDEYPPVEIASRIDDYTYPLILEEFHFEDVQLEEGEYQKLFDEPEARTGRQIAREHLNEMLQKMRDEVEDMSIDDLLAEPMDMSF